MIQIDIPLDNNAPTPDDATWENLFLGVNTVYLW